MKQSCYQMMHAQEREALASCIFLTKRRARRGNFIRASITINLSHNQVYVTLHCLCFLPARRKKNIILTQAVQIPPFVIKFH